MEQKTYTCPRCKTEMPHPPRDYNICPNEECFVEFGFDWPECDDNGKPYDPDEPLVVDDMEEDDRYPRRGDYLRMRKEQHEQPNETK